MKILNWRKIEAIQHRIRTHLIGLAIRGLLVDSSMNPARGLRSSALVSIEHGRQFFAFGNESNGKGVNAVAGLLFCKAFALEDVA